MPLQLMRMGPSTAIGVEARPAVRLRVHRLVLTAPECRCWNGEDAPCPPRPGTGVR